MFSTISERRMRLVRWLLVGGWLVIITSLFWDPLTPRLNDPANTASPFRLDRAATAENPADRYACPLRVPDPVGGTRVDWRGYEPGQCDARCPRVQGACVVEQPYGMGARLFWTILVPIVPFFLLVFGHEAWRRLCPLSALMQIPRRLGIQRKRKIVNQKTGLVDAQLVLPAPGSWLVKYFWYLQFGLLWLGVSLRIVFINSDRLALAIFFLAVIVLAITVGYLYGGKTWCNYICPLAPVQKIYTEPRGLLESKAHLAKGLPQSMCRTVDASGKDQSSCVGCKSPCPDTDLERQYWSELTKPGRRFFYYGYFGLVIGFYTYYTLYAGNWGYYFSGAWTHEEDQLSRIFGPGFYLGGQAIGIPKIVAAPATIALFIVAAYGLGRALEAAYAGWRRRRGRPLSEGALLHRTFTLSAFVTFNTFYLFGGRPNLRLLPPLALTLVDFTIIAASAIWMARTWPRTSDQYERESVVNSLRRQLGKLKLDFGKLLGGRSVEQLSSDEVYVLAKTLPSLSEQERRRTYKETLRETLAGGHAGNAAGLSVLAEIREQLGVTEDEHNAILTELGIEDESLLDPDEAMSQEKRLRLQSFREAIEGMVRQWAGQGLSIVEALRDERIRSDIRRLQAIYTITAEEQARILEEVFGQDDIAFRQARDVADELARLRAWDQVAAARAAEDENPALVLFRRFLARRSAQLAERVLTMVAGVAELDKGIALARRVRALAPSAVERLLVEGGLTEQADPKRRLPPAIIAALRDGAADAPELPALEAPLEELFRRALHQWEPIARAVALWALSVRDPIGARAEAQALLDKPELLHWLVAAAARAAQGGATEPVLERLALLYDSPFFNHLEPDTLAQLARSAELRAFAAGELIYREGEPSAELLYVTRGGADVWVERDGGTRKVGEVAPGQTIGELGVLTRAPRSANVAAASAGVEVLVIEGAQLERLFADNGRAATSFLRMTGERLSRTLGQLG